MTRRKKPRTIRHTSRAEAWRRIQITMQAASTEAQDDDVHRWLATTGYTLIERLMGGTFDQADHMSAVKLNAFACILAVEIMPSLDDASRAIVATAHESTVQAAEALHDIGQRHRDTGVFGVTGRQLTTLRESFALLDTLVSYANRGETMRAMSKMETMIGQRMAELQKERKCRSD